MKKSLCISQLRRCALLVAALGLVWAFSTGCGSECADDELFVEWEGEEQCLLACGDDDECDEGEECHSQGFCVEDDDFEPPECTEDEDCEDGEICDEDTQECVVDGYTDEEVCDLYCDLDTGCLLDNCAVQLQGDPIQDCLLGTTDPQTGQEIPGCYEQYGSDDDYTEFVDWLVFGDHEDLENEELSDDPNDCDYLRYRRCSVPSLEEHCDCTAPSNLGEVCTDAADCDNGSLRGADCSPDPSELDPNDPDPDDADGGMCVAFTCGVHTDAEPGDVAERQGCGVGGGCRAETIPDSQQLVGVCFDLCDSNAECGDGLSCQIIGAETEVVLGQGIIRTETGAFARGCNFECTGDDDCADDARCNDHGICEFACDSADSVEFCETSGEACVADDDECASDGDCDGDEECVSISGVRECVDPGHECDDDDGCTGDEICYEGGEVNECIEPADDECEDGDDDFCETEHDDDHFCLSHELGNECVTHECDEDANCGDEDDFDCVDADGVNICVEQECQEDADCGDEDDFVCLTSGDANTCLEHECDADDEDACDDGEFCSTDGDANECVAISWCVLE